VIEITQGFRLINFDSKSITKRIDRICGEIIRESAREWLRAVLKSVPARGGFPVWSGAAKSTLAPLGRFLRVALGSTSPVSGAPNRTDLGEASQKFVIIDDATRGVNYDYVFEWSTDLLHYYINEFYGYIPFAPWQTTDAGHFAFVRNVQASFDRRLPNIGEFFT
jgi:hypothetical protein